MMPTTRPARGPDKDTVAMYFVHAATAKLSAEARARVLAAAGIPVDMLKRPQGRVPAQAYSALWLAVARELDDELFGLGARGMRVGSFALMSQAVLGCENLERAAKRILRSFAVFVDWLGGEFARDGDDAVVTVVNTLTDPADRRYGDEVFLILFHGLLSWMAGRRIALHAVEFAYPRPAHAAEYTRMYSQHLVFDAPRTRLRFDAGLLAGPVVQTPASLKKFLRDAPQSVFLKYRNEDSWTARLRRHLRGFIGADAWPGFDEVAASFGIAPTTLRRRLDAEGTSYDGLRNQLRADLAIDRLVRSAMGIHEIATELGFQDASAFHRAFKRWTGVPPSVYRARQRASGGSD